MRIGLFGQGKIAKECFLSVLTKMDNVSLKFPLIVTDCAIEEIIKSHSLDRQIMFFSSKEKNNESILKLIKELDIDCIISVQYPWILSKDIIDACNGFTFNLHNAKLPDYRGHNSLTHEIINCDKNHTITLHWLVPEVDRGFFAYTDSMPIEKNETSFSLYKKCIPRAIILFNRLVSDINSSTKPPKEPILGKGKYYNKSSLSNIKSIKSNNIDDIIKHARALSFPKCEPGYIIHNEKKVYILDEDVYKLNTSS